MELAIIICFGDNDYHARFMKTILILNGFSHSKYLGGMHLFTKLSQNRVKTSIFYTFLRLNSGKMMYLYPLNKSLFMDDLTPKKKKSRKGWTLFLGIVILALGIFIYVRYYYVFGTGVKSGELNYLVYKGVVFKTYEGKLIQSGFRADMPGGLQSNQFDFSVEDKEIAQRLMVASGKIVQLHYREYFGTLPWRGYTKFIVDSIITIEEKPMNPLSEEELTPYILESM